MNLSDSEAMGGVIEIAWPGPSSPTFWKRASEVTQAQSLERVVIEEAG